MVKKDYYFIALMIAIVGLFTFLWAIGRKAPGMTVRAEHAGITKETPRETCFECHTPLPPRHPKKGLPDEVKGRPDKQPTPCAECHRLPQAAVAGFSKTREGNLSWLNRRER